MKQAKATETSPKKTSPRLVIKLATGEVQEALLDGQPIPWDQIEIVDLDNLEEEEAEEDD